MPENEFYDQVKKIIKRVPGTKALNNVRLNILRVRELSDLIKEKQIAVFHLNSRLENNTAAQCMVHKLVQEWLDLYGVIHLKKTTATAIDAPPGAYVLFAPQALLRIPSSHAEYIKALRHETRKAIRLAERQGFEFKEFVWNDYLDDIYEINTSKEMRQNKPMNGWYREYVQPRYPSEEERRYQKYYGAFKDGKLFAYLHCWICGDFAIGKHFIGHAKYLRYGVMNSLMSYTVGECIKNSQTQWLYYGDYQKDSLGSFKKHAGFQVYTLLIDFDGDQELLKYSARKVRTVWRL